MADEKTAIPSDGFLENIFVFDKAFVMIDIIDTFESIYWIDRYNETGDFELVMPVLENNLPFLRIGNYIGTKETDQFMIIENVTLKTDVENGDRLVISGRSAESMLDRRIVWYKISSSDSLQNIVKKALLQNAIAPSNPKRNLPITYHDSEDPYILNIREEVSLFGENLYNVISSFCQAYNIGLKAIPINDGTFEIMLYYGVDRTWDQNEVPPVVFSNSYENLIESNYVQTDVEYVSSGLVRGDDDSITMEVRRNPERVGLNRREMFIDTNIQPDTQEVMEYELDETGNRMIEEYQRTDKNGEPLYDPETGDPVMAQRYKTRTKNIKIYDKKYYNSMLSKAKSEMGSRVVTEAFDSSVDITQQFLYGQDYFLGDIVQVENKYGYSGRCRISEIMRSRDASGPKLVPSFIMVDKNGNEVTT